MRCQGRRTSLQRVSLSPQTQGKVPPIVHSVLRRPGQPLDPTVRRRMEHRFAQDFSRVRVHTDTQADQSAREVQAQAYTVGQDIVFANGSYSPETRSGSKILAHELTHTIQQRYVQTQRSSHLRVESGASPLERQAERISSSSRAHGVLARPALQRQPNACELMRPETCPTYEEWISQFTGISESFVATSGHEVLGQVPAQRGASVSAAQRAAPAVGPRATDRFIDHPTDQWVRQNLPANLRETAYRLPSDCADIAVILRHVWLSAHYRVETYRGWIVGDRAGRASRRRVGGVIRSVFTGNLRAMVAPYADDSGTPLRSFDELQNLLHPGDILVWEHHSGGAGTARTGGHAHTIESITRAADGTITAITLLMGNQPISGQRAQAIRAQERQAGRQPPSEAALRAAPGRRIERDQMTRDNDLQDLNDVWTWANGTTTLVVAGPPKAARRPPPRRRRGQRRARRSVRDWLRALRVANRRTLPGVFESALLEIRAVLESGRAVSNADARAIGEAAGNRLWTLAKRARDLGSESHFQPLSHLRAALRAMRDNANTANVAPVFNVIDDSFMMAARGASSVEFTRRGLRRAQTIETLVTGFDPFDPGGSMRPPSREQWNPSGAVALAMDGKTFNAGGRIRAVVESVVLPVSFSEFRQGLVERIVGQHINQLDAVITVSMDPNIPPTRGVAIERFAVGAHELASGNLEPIPTAPGGSPGPAIIETSAPVDPIAAERSLRAQPPTVRNDISLRFSTSSVADQALIDLGLPASGSRDVTISSLSAIRQILQIMRQPNPARAHHIQFRAGTTTYTADVVSGPGGNFLSNEVSYRVLRQLSRVTGRSVPASFHIHTQRGDPVPRPPSRARTRALGVARRLRSRLIRTIRRIIVALARRLGASSSQRGGNP